MQDVIGGCGPADHGEGGDVQVEAKMTDTMPILWGGSDSVVYDIASDSNTQDGARAQLEPAASQSSITTFPHV